MPIARASSCSASAMPPRALTHLREPTERRHNERVVPPGRALPDGEGATVILKGVSR
jgi:hypothetical protein